MEGRGRAGGVGMGGLGLGLRPCRSINPIDSTHPSIYTHLTCIQHSKINQACVDVGFLYVTNTGVPTQTTQNALDLARTFFALPQVCV